MGTDSGHFGTTLLVRWWWSWHLRHLESPLLDAPVVDGALSIFLSGFQDRSGLSGWLKPTQKSVRPGRGFAPCEWLPTWKVARPVRDLVGGQRRAEVGKP